MIRGTKRPRIKAIEIIEPRTQKVDVKLNASIHNRFDIEVVDAKTGKVKQRAQAENVICNQLWTKLLEPNAYFAYISFGTGTGTPSASDVSLFTHLASKTGISPEYTFNWDNSWVSLRKQCQLSETEYIGSILSEVGISYGSSTSTLCTHALLKDMNGNPITLTKTSTDIINIYATVFVHFPYSGFDNGAIRLIWNSASPTWQALLGNMSLSTTVSDAMCTLGATPWSGSDRQSNSSIYYRIGVSRAYSVANKTITCTLSRLPVAAGNINGFRGVTLNSVITYGNSPVSFPWCQFLVGGSAYEKTDIVGESIGTGDGVTSDFSFGFSCIQAGAKIYLNGVEQTNYTIDIDAPLLPTNMEYYFETIEANTGSIVNTTYATRNVAGDYCVLYNPFFTYGLSSFKYQFCTVECSNDMSTWVLLASASSTEQYLSVPLEYRYYKYWRLTKSGSNTAYFRNIIAYNVTAKHLHFSTPPAADAIITADYTTKTIAKDVNHVLDFSFTIQLGEYTE